MTVNDASLGESGSKLSKVAATSLLMGVTRASSEAYLLAEYLVRQTMAARGHMNGWPAVGGTGWSAQRGSLQYQIFRYGIYTKKGD